MDLLEKTNYDELVEKTNWPHIKNMIHSAQEDQGFYSEKFSKAQIDIGSIRTLEAFAALPFTTKTELLNAQTQIPPFGNFLGCMDMRKIVRVHRTSGTTGRALFIPMSAGDIENTRIAGRRAFACAGLAIDDCVVHCLNYCMWAGGVTDHISLEATGAAVIPFGVGHTHQLIESILALRANAISCTPSYLLRLLDVLKDDFSMEPRQLGLKKAFFGGEGGLQNPQVRAHIEGTWGLKAIDANYGMADVLSVFGAECDERKGLHFHGQGIVHMELINPDSGLPLSIQAGAIGELVLTNLVRECQPLIRYRTGDVVAILGLDECGCGRKSPRFAVIGRSDQMIVVRGVNVFPGGIKNALLEDPESFTGEFRIELDTPPPHNAVRLLVEVREGMGTEGKLQALKSIFKKKLNFSPEINWVQSGSLPKTEGKTNYVIRNYKSSRA